MSRVYIIADLGVGGYLISLTLYCLYIYEDEPLSVPPPPLVLTSICEPFIGGREEDEGLVSSGSSGGFWTGEIEEEEPN